MNNHSQPYTKTHRHFSVNLSLETRRKIEKLADERNHSMSRVVEEILCDFFKNHVPAKK